MGHLQHVKLIRWYFSLALIEGIGALLWLLLIPTESGRGSMLGLSFGRIILITPLILMSLVLFWVVYNIWLRPVNSETWVQRLEAYAAKDLFYWTTIALAIVGGIIGINLLGTRTSAPFIQAYLVRLVPYAIFILLISAQTLIAIRWLRFGWGLKVFQPQMANFIASLLVLGVLILIGTLILWTRIGLEPDITGWGTPGVPLLPSQVWLALVITLVGVGLGTIVLLLFKRLTARFALRLLSWKLDAIVFLLLWLAAVWRWSAEPLKASFFAPDPTPPNYEYYPFSDAAKYDLSAQKLLVGVGFEQGITRPVYSAYIALAQGVSGVGLDSVIDWQIPLLAFIPPLLYLLTKALHHRIAGLILGILAIFRESNSIALAGIINVSNVKMMMSDMPTSLGVILFSLIVILWLQKPRERQVYLVLAGGVLAVSMLIRSQILLLFPAVMLCAWFVLHKQPARWVKSALIILAGLVLTLSPWLWRNWQLTGKKLISDTQPSGAVFRFSSLRLNDSARLPGETDEEFFLRMRANAFREVLSHPLETTQIITAHFWHNQVSTLLILPSSFPILTEQQIPSEGLSGLNSTWKFIRGQCCSPTTYVRELPYWKIEWTGTFIQESWLPLFTSLLLVSVGIGMSWKRWRFIGLLPIFVIVGYSLGNSLGRISGWRYNLPVDWVGMLYYSIGLAQVCFWMLTLFADRFFFGSWDPGMAATPDADQVVRPLPWKRIVMPEVALLMLVASIPLTERLIPVRYTPDIVHTTLNSLSSTIDQDALRSFLDEDNAVALVGRAMYPRYYPASDGIPYWEWQSYFTRDYSRLGFILVGSEIDPVILPLEEPPSAFPNAADVLVLGCKREGYIESRLVALLSQPKAVIQASPPRVWSCTAP